MLFKFLHKDDTQLVALRDLGIKCDIHSHLLPNLDDGSQSVKDSIDLIRGLKEYGYDKIIVTPHVMNGFYNNSNESITNALNLLKEELGRQQIDIDINAGAEYYIDYDFMQSLDHKEMMTIGNKMLLFECSFTNPHSIFDETVFKMQINGYTPVLAHPERYLYWHGNLDKMKDLHDRGIMFQINLLSIANAYSPSVNKEAKTLIENGLCDFIGTDLHNAEQLSIIRNACIPARLFERLKSLNLQNNCL